MPFSRNQTNTGSNKSGDQTEKFEDSNIFIDKPNLSKSIGCVTSSQNKNLNKNFKTSIHSIDSLNIQETSQRISSGKHLKQVTPTFKAQIQKNKNDSA